MKNHPYKIAIVGLGPKGLYGFERILAQLKANPIQEKVEIHLFNKTRFMGSGDIYRSDQPDYLLMNFANRHINMWTEESPTPVVKRPLSFSEHIALEKQIPLDEVEPLYAPRSTVGDYLEKGFAQLGQSLPENVILQQHIAEVRSMEKTDESYSIGFMQREKACRLSGFQHILITTGHQRHKETTKTNHHKVPFIYPVQQKLNGVTERDNIVAVKGMGLTFIDAVLALTEGKGGVFTKTGDGTLIYKASGKEPKQIFPFSKSGWPMLPKYDSKLNEDTELYVKSLQSPNHKKLNFEKEILPLIEQDMEYAYYRTLFAHEKEVLDYHRNYDEVNDQIHSFHQTHPEYDHFSLERLLDPEFNPAKSSHQNIVEYLTAFTCENRHIVQEAQLRAAAVWRRISPVFNEVYSFSGLDAASHQEFDSYYFGKLNRIAYGPPPVNLKKILALANTGILNFQFAKNPHVEPVENGFMLSNGITEIYCDVLIDARIPKNSMKKEATGLFTNLCENQLARPYINKDEKFSHAPGTLEIDRDGNLMNPQGTPENITLYGTPTEGIVHDNDTLSRSRNNFAGPWARAVIQHVMNGIDEINKQTSNTFAHTE